MTTGLKRKVEEAFNEPGCAANRGKSTAERKGGCAKSTKPGAAAGGCAFDGAKIALQPITDAAHLVHGPIACEGNSWDTRHTGSSGPQLYRTSFTTDLSELDVIHGGEKRLARAIREVVGRYHPPAVFVYQTCVTALVGEDTEQVCKDAAAETGTPVIPVLSPGFVGSKNLGNKLAGGTLLDYVIGTVEPEVTTPTDINLLGEYNVAGELWQVIPLFEQLGIRILASITGDGRYRDVAAAHRARVNFVVCSQALVAMARKMEERYGIPYLEGSFYGVANTNQALRGVAQALVDRGASQDLLSRTEALIAEKEAVARAALAPYRARLQGKRVLLYTGGVKSWSVIAALEELGLEVIGTSVRKSTPEDKDRIREMMGTDERMFDTLPPREMYQRLSRGEADMLMSGGRTQFVALKAKVPWVDINQERRYAYAGYEGVVRLAQEIDRSFSNPVWNEVRRAAPWESLDGHAG